MNGIIQGEFALDEFFWADYNYTIDVEIANNTATGEFTAREIQGWDWAGDWFKWLIHNLIFIVGIIIFLVFGWMVIKNLVLK
jgi:hypothetical protein